MGGGLLLVLEHLVHPLWPGLIAPLIGDADTVSRMIEDASRHVKFNAVFLLFGQGVPDRATCLKTL